MGLGPPSWRLLRTLPTEPASSHRKVVARWTAKVTRTLSISLDGEQRGGGSVPRSLGFGSAALGDQQVQIYRRADCQSTPLTLFEEGKISLDATRCCGHDAVLWSWSDEKSLTQRFFTARKICVKALGKLALGTRKGKKGEARQPAGSYQAFRKMFRTWTTVLVLQLMVVFRQRMRTALPDRMLIAGFEVGRRWSTAGDTF